MGDYRIGRELGRGGMGVVYEATDDVLGRRVALKVMPTQGLARPSQIERFELEARAAARLHHANIVAVFGAGCHEGLYYYAMQYIPGRGLDAVLNELRWLRSPVSPGGKGPDQGMPDPRPADGLSASAIARSLVTGSWPRTDDRLEAPPIPDDPTVDRAAEEAGRDRETWLSHPPAGEYFRAVAAVGLQVAEALAYAHGRGVVHRDIKPSNLLLDDRGHAWVADFGLAKVDGADGPTRTGDLVGTLRYMAPERFDGWSDPRSDVYSLAATLYEMLTLRPAFDSSTAGALIERVRQEDPPRLRTLDRRIPLDLETIVLRALSKEPSTRYPSAEAIAEDLRRFLADRPILSRRNTSLERVRRWHRRNPLAAGLAWTLLLVLVGGFTGMTRLYLEADRQRRASERNFHDAHTAVDTLLTDISENTLLDRPGMETVRKELLGAALAYYRRFSERRPDDPTILPKLAWAYFRVGLVASKLGESNEALDAFRHSLKIRQRLLDLNPTPPDGRLELAYSHHKLGDTLAELGRTYEALQDLERACMLLEALVREGSPSIARPALSDALSCRGALMRRIGRADDAERILEELVALAEANLAESPADERAIRGLAKALNNLGNAKQQVGRRAGAEASYRRAIAVLDPFIQAHPGDVPGREGLSSARTNLGTLLMFERPDEAERLLRRGTDLLEAVVRDHPDLAESRRQLARGCNNLAVALNSTGRHCEAGPSWRRAAAQYEALRAPTPLDRLELAQALAMAHAAAPGPDLGKAPPRNSLADRAVAALRSALEADPGLISLVERNPMLSPIQDRPEVRSAMARAAKRKP
jgi:serine/threonine protein kinase